MDIPRSVVTIVPDTPRLLIELQQEIQKEGGKYVRHSLKNPGQPLAPKDSGIPQSIATFYAEIDKLAAEKIALAERLVSLIQRARARLDHDLTKVLVLQGEPAPEIQTSYSFGQGLRNPAERITESLRNAIAIPEASPAPPASAAPPQKSTHIQLLILVRRADSLRASCTYNRTKDHRGSFSG